MSGLPARPPRRMPALWTLASYWAARFGLDGDALAVPFCFGCGTEMPADGATPERRWNRAAGRLERAHLVDRFLGGLDGPQNVIPLCVLCHKLMPMFDIEQGDAALAWVTGGGGTSFLFDAIARIFARMTPDELEAAAAAE